MSLDDIKRPLGWKVDTSGITLVLAVLQIAGLIYFGGVKLQHIEDSVGYQDTAIKSQAAAIAALDTITGEIPLLKQRDDQLEASERVAVATSKDAADSLNRISTRINALINMMAVKNGISVIPSEPPP